MVKIIYSKIFLILWNKDHIGNVFPSRASSLVLARLRSISSLSYYQQEVSWAEAESLLCWSPQRAGWRRRRSGRLRGWCQGYWSWSRSCCCHRNLGKQQKESSDQTENRRTSTLRMLKQHVCRDLSANMRGHEWGTRKLMDMYVKVERISTCLQEVCPTALGGMFSTMSQMSTNTSRPRLYLRSDCLL